MMALDEETLDAIVRLMGDDAPAGFGQRALAGYGPGSAWAGAEPYGGPCPHDERWGVQCGSCPHEGKCGPFPSTFEMLVRDYLAATGRRPVGIDPDPRGEGGQLEEIPF